MILVLPSNISFKIANMSICIYLWIKVKMGWMRMDEDGCGEERKIMSHFHSRDYNEK